MQTYIANEYSIITKRQATQLKIGIGLQCISLQIRHTNGQQAHKKMKWKSKPQWDTTSYPLGWLVKQQKQQKRKITNVRENVEKLEPLLMSL